jgi:hypothetical protein
MSAMSCDRARALVLQPLAPADDVAAARTHLLQCPLCASETAGDIEEQVSSQLRLLQEPGSAVRLGLLMIGGFQVLLALPWIFGTTILWGPRSDTSIAHLTRDGVIGLVLGLAGVAVALSPRLAYFALSVCGLLVSLQAVAFVTDRVNSKVHPVFETIHVLAVIITVLVIVMAFPRRTRR